MVPQIGSKSAELRRTHVQTRFGPCPGKFGILSRVLVVESAPLTLTAIEAFVTFNFTNCDLQKCLVFYAATLTILW